MTSVVLLQCGLDEKWWADSEVFSCAKFKSANPYFLVRQLNIIRYLQKKNQQQLPEMLIFEDFNAKDVPPDGDKFVFLCADGSAMLAEKS